MKDQINSPGNTARRQDGGVLLAAMLLTIIAGLWIGGFLQLSQNEVRISQSALQFNCSLNLAEGAAEKAVHALHHKDQWTMGSGVMDEVEIDLGRGIKGTMRARIYDYTGKPTDQPRIVAEGIVVQPNLPNATRRLEMRFVPRSPFDGIHTTRFRANGKNTYIDSYDSAHGFYKAEYLDAETGETLINRSANATLATYSGSAEPAEDTDIGHIKIFGYVTTPPDSTFSRGQHGIVTALNPVQHDPKRVTKDYAEGFEVKEVPTATVTISEEEGNIVNDFTLPLPGYPPEVVYQVDNIKLNNATLTIDGPVNLVVTGEIDIGGNTGSIAIGSQGSLELFAGGDVKISGGGLINLKDQAKPADFLIWGTAAISQDFDLGGNGAWSAGVFAPNADITLGGGGGGTGEFFGSIVANSVTISGTYSIHVDLDLRNITDGTYRVDYWRELFSLASN